MQVLGERYASQERQREPEQWHLIISLQEINCSRKQDQPVHTIWAGAPPLPTFRRIHTSCVAAFKVQLSFSIKPKPIRPKHYYYYKLSKKVCFTHHCPDHRGLCGLDLLERAANEIAIPRQNHTTTQGYARDSACQKNTH